MTKNDNVANRAVKLPDAPLDYDKRHEQTFRLTVEQEVQQIYTYIADLLERVEDLEP